MNRSVNAAQTWQMCRWTAPVGDIDAQFEPIVDRTQRAFRVMRVMFHDVVDDFTNLGSNGVDERDADFPALHLLAQKCNGGGDGRIRIIPNSCDALLCTK